MAEYLERDLSQIKSPEFTTTTTRKSKSKRTKWNREEYKVVIYAYYFSLSRPTQEKHTANSYRIWRSRNPASRPNLDENRLANVRRDIFRNTRLTDAELTSIKKVEENDLKVSQERNNEAEERNVGAQALTERRPSAETTQDPEEKGKYNDPRKNSQENDVETEIEDQIFAEQHRKSIIEMKQDVLNELAVKDAQSIGRKLDNRNQKEIHIEIAIQFANIKSNAEIYHTHNRPIEKK
ncbi:Hypothetical predicted protein [Octopus vulgaris]|uniref:Uncharacterized protein n=1 Tax=Octopus vulgaris TaxID=6645 RepID=A0AA36FC39_OCTVU|nr:Hypothetical predicted protein [Octopus vulgaris]